MHIARIGDEHLYVGRERWGGKGTTLLELGELLDNIPPGFVISTDTYRDFVRENNLTNFMNNLNGVPEEVHERVRQTFRDSNFPDNFLDMVKQNFDLLNPPIVARSSGVDEDGNKNSFAGRHETVLGITSLEGLLDGIKECYTSLYNPLAITYRRRRNLRGPGSMAVVVQNMINPESSGVVYSVSPMSRNSILVESAWGLGTSVVNSDNCDVFVVDASSDDEYELKNKIIGRKEHMEIFDPTNGRMVIRDVPEELIEVESLSDDKVLEIARMTKEIERMYGPVDVEFCHDRSNFWILQSRPITSLNFEDEKWLPNVSPEKILGESYCMNKKGMYHGKAIVVKDVGLTTGYVVDGGSIEKLDKKFKGYILITPRLNPDLESHLINAKAIVATECGSTGHAAATAREKGILYLGATMGMNGNILEMIRTGDNVGIAVNNEKGILYKSDFHCRAGLKVNKRVKRLAEWCYENFDNFQWTVRDQIFYSGQSFPHVEVTSLFKLPNGKIVEENDWIEDTPDLATYRLEEKHNLDSFTDELEFLGVKHYTCKGYRARDVNGHEIKDKIPCVGCPFEESNYLSKITKKN